MGDLNSCPKDCPEDSEENLIGSSTGASRNVICGSDGNTYRSECDMKRRTCGQLVVEAPMGNCEGTRHCSTNLAAPRCPRSKKHMHIVPISRCHQTFKFVFTGCSRVCPTNYEP